LYDKTDGYTAGTVGLGSACRRHALRAKRSKHAVFTLYPMGWDPIICATTVVLA